MSLLSHAGPPTPPLVTPITAEEGEIAEDVEMREELVPTTAAASAPPSAPTNDINASGTPRPPSPSPPSQPTDPDLDQAYFDAMHPLPFADPQPLANFDLIGIPLGHDLGATHPAQPLRFKNDARSPL